MPPRKVRVAFRLSMPGCPSWNGHWSGEGRNYIIVKSLSEDSAKILLAGEAEKSWRHYWEDGWCAQVTARVVPKGEKLLKSAGFCGYDWMVENILDHGDTRKKDELKAGAGGAGA